MDEFGRIAGSHPKARQPADALGPEPGLLLQLTLHGRVRVLIYIHHPRRDLQQLVANRPSELANEYDVTVAVHRYNRDRASVLHDLALRLPAVVEANRVDPQVEDLPFVDSLALYGLFFQPVVPIDE